MYISPFGDINPEQIKDYYDASIQIGDEMVEIDLNFELESVEASLLQDIQAAIAKISKLASIAWEAISEDWDLDEDSETARFYLQHHLDEFDEDEIMQIFGTADVTKPIFMKALSLVRIGLYPEDEESFILFDIQFPEELTDYLMSVRMTKDGQVNDISFES